MSSVRLVDERGCHEFDKDMVDAALAILVEADVTSDGFEESLLKDARVFEALSLYYQVALCKMLKPPEIDDKSEGESLLAIVWRYEGQVEQVNVCKDAAVLGSICAFIEKEISCLVVDRGMLEDMRQADDYGGVLFTLQDELDGSGWEIELTNNIKL